LFFFFFFFFFILEFARTGYPFSSQKFFLFNFFFFFFFTNIRFFSERHKPPPPPPVRYLTAISEVNCFALFSLLLVLHSFLNYTFTSVFLSRTIQSTSLHQWFLMTSRLLNSWTTSIKTTWKGACPAHSLSHLCS